MANDGPTGGDRPEPWQGQRSARGRGRGRTVALLAVPVVALLAVGAVRYLLTSVDDGPPSAGALPSATAPADPPDVPVDGPSSTLAPESSADPRFARAGQCVRNEGPVGGRPKLVVTGCAPETYEVLRRFDGATSGEQDAEAKCAAVDGYTDWYFFNSELDTLDFVLCLKLR